MVDLVVVNNVKTMITKHRVFNYDMVCVYADQHNAGVTKAKVIWYEDYNHEEWFWDYAWRP